MTRQSFLGILLAIAVCTAARPIHATPITVTTTDDELNTNGNCSLREAVRAANTNVAVDACPAGQNDQTDTITVPAGTYTLTLAGVDNDASAGDLDLLNNAAIDDLVITGAGAATTIVQACTVDQQAADCPAGQGVFERVFHVIDGSVAISGLTVRHGRAPALGSLRSGHGIYIQKINGIAPPVLALTDVVVTKNGRSNETLQSNGGGIANEDSRLTLTRVSVTDNIGGSGGGIYNAKLTDGEPILTMTDSTVSGNKASAFGGGLHDKQEVTATLTGCTISGNEAGASGGGISSLSSSTATLTNCTVSGNSALGSFGGGIYNSGGVMNLRSTTVTLNRLGQGQGAGGITTISSPIVLRNSIVAGNIHELNPASVQYSPDCDAGGLAVSSEGHNLVGEGLQCPGLVGGTNGDQVGTTGAAIDAKLGPLADNGGPTLTHGWLPGSPAIDAADPAPPGSGGTACPTTDQRGETRPRGAACDIGAVELGDVGTLAVEAVQPAVGGTSGTVLARIFGRAFAADAEVRLVRAGFADVVGTRVGNPGSIITASLDLRGVTPGLWSVRVQNSGASGATLPDAFTVEAGGGPDLWANIVLPRAFIKGRNSSLYLQFGNRGTVDARAVPLWLSFPDEFDFGVPFPVLPPPAVPGQIATDWKLVDVDAPIPPPENRDSFPFLLPFVPAGSTGTLRIHLRSPGTADPSRLPFHVTADIGAPYFKPDLAPNIVADYVERAKELAAPNDGTSASLPSDAAIEAYVRSQLAAVVAEGTASVIANLNIGGDPTLYSQTQLLTDTGQFIASASTTAFAAGSVPYWIARLFDDLGGRSAEARLNNGVCGLFTDDQFCERPQPHMPPQPIPCPFPSFLKLCDTAPPIIKCNKFNFINEELVFVPCKKPTYDAEGNLIAAADPNDKVGPGGPGGFINGLTPLPYTVLFENKPTATADALEVTVTDQLDVAKYDLTTFSLGLITFGDRLVTVPPGLTSFSTEVDLRPGKNILVGIDAALDAATGIVTWKFTTLDPATHEFPEEPDVGFLPPNVTQPEGEGAMLFTVSLKPGFPLGTTVCNDASIVFDFNDPIVTPEFCNTIGSPEDCENCIDDDGDTLIDRADPDCAAPANGAGAGVGDATIGKAVDKCAKAIRKVGAKLTSNRLKQLGACEKAVADCMQLKPGDAACLAAAHGKCTKARTALPGAEAKLTAAIAKTCGEPAVTPANLDAAAGLGFGGETSACAGRGVATLATVADVAECVRRQHQCAAERVLGAAVPRARELLVLGGFDLATDFRCLEAGANGGGSAIAAEKRKALRKCDGALQKAATKLLAGRAKAADACGGAVFTCLQTKPGDPACVTKAGGTCTKAIAGIPKLEAGFTTTVAKACGASPLIATDLLTSEGLGASALGARCAQLGIPSLATVADVTACLEKQLTCHVDHVLENTTPRLGELLDLGGVTLP